MRPLVLAAILAALVGCSMPYEGASFAALPKPERMAEGEHRETNEHAMAEGGHQIGIASKIYEGDADPADGVQSEGPDRTGAAFPKTSPPSKVRLTSGAGYRSPGEP